MLKIREKHHNKGQKKEKGEEAERWRKSEREGGIDLLMIKAGDGK